MRFRELAAHRASPRPCAAQVAVKVSRQEPKYHDAGMRELQTLIFLKRKDPGERYQCVAGSCLGARCAPLSSPGAPPHMPCRSCIRARRWFELGGHVFAVYDLLGPSVLNLMRIAPLSRAQLAHAARQLTECIAYILSLPPARRWRRPPASFAPG